MPESVGSKIALSLPRRLACDLSYFAKRIPSVPVQRRMNIAAVVAARDLAQREWVGLEYRDRYFRCS